MWQSAKWHVKYLARPAVRTKLSISSGTSYCYESARLRDRRIKRISFGWHSIPTSFPLRNIPIERSVLRIPRNVLFTRRVSIPCFRSIKGSAISWKSQKPHHGLFLLVSHIRSLSFWFSKLCIHCCTLEFVRSLIHGFQKRILSILTRSEQNWIIKRQSFFIWHDVYIKY